MDRKIDRQKHGQTETLINIKQIDKNIYREKHRWTYTQIDKNIDGQKHRWTEKQIDSNIDRQ